MNAPVGVSSRVVAFIGSEVRINPGDAVQLALMPQLAGGQLAAGLH